MTAGEVGVVEGSVLSRIAVAHSRACPRVGVGSGDENPVRSPNARFRLDELVSRVTDTRTPKDTTEPIYAAIELRFLVSDALLLLLLRATAPWRPPRARPSFHMQPAFPFRPSRTARALVLVELVAGFHRRWRRLLRLRGLGHRHICSGGGGGGGSS